MTILQHDVNNHIADGAHFHWWPSVLPDSKLVSLLSKGLLNLEPPLCSSGYAPGVKVFITSFMRVAYPLKYPSNACLSCLVNTDVSIGICTDIAISVKKHRLVDYF